MPTKEKEEHLVRCVLCGGQCSLDCRVYHRVAGWMSLLFGWVAFPVLGVLLGEFANGLCGIWDRAEFVLWLVATLYLLLKPALWVCRTCGAYYPARKVEPRAGAAPKGGIDAQRGD